MCEERVALSNYKKLKKLYLHTMLQNINYWCFNSRINDNESKYQNLSEKSIDFKKSHKLIKKNL